MPGEEPKIIIDSDWKAQAQAEKEKLAQQAAPTKGQGPKGAGPEEEEASFDEIIRMIAMQALTFLGEMPDPVSGQRIFAPEYAKRYIDMLGILEEKTKGNLTPQESESLSLLGADLRGAFVELNRAVAKAVAEGKIKPRGAAPAGGSPGAAPGAPASPAGGGPSKIIAP